MDNNFLEAFENSNTLQENFLDGVKKVAGDAVNTINSNIQVNKQNKANAEKQNAANVNADVSNKNGYQQIIADLQKIANEQVQFDEKSIDAFIKKINNLKSLDDKSKKQINQMLNQQKAALQQAAEQAKPEQQKTNATDAQLGQKDADTTTDGGNASATGTGDPSKVTNSSVGQTLVNSINRLTVGENPQANVDDIIAYLQTLKK